MLALQQFDISFMKEDSIRANMDDMLTYKEIHAKKELERKKVPSPTLHQEFTDVDGTLFFDGAFKRSACKGAIQYVFMYVGNKDLWFSSQEVNVESNDEVQYVSLCMGLEECRRGHVMKLVIKGDSMLIVRQVQGTWKVNKEETKDWFFKAKKFLESFIAYQTWHVPQTRNVRAHQLAKEVFDKHVNVVSYKSLCILEDNLCMRKSMYCIHALQGRG